MMDSLKIFFHKMEKLLPVERIFEKLEKNGENEGFVVKINLH